MNLTSESLSHVLFSSESEAQPAITSPVTNTVVTTPRELISSSENRVETQHVDASLNVLMTDLASSTENYGDT